MDLDALSDSSSIDVSSMRDSSEGTPIVGEATPLALEYAESVVDGASLCVPVVGPSTPDLDPFVGEATPLAAEDGDSMWNAFQACNDSTPRPAEVSHMLAVFDENPLLAREDGNKTPDGFAPAGEATSSAATGGNITPGALAFLGLSF